MEIVGAPKMGWPNHPQALRGGFDHPLPAVEGGRSHP
jgi:hypothetical protein